MKGLIIFGLLSVCLVGVYSDLVLKADANARTKCAEESGVDVKILMEMGEQDKFIQDEKVGCYFACILKGEGAFDENGTIKSNHPSYPKNPKAKKCANLRGKNDCETANKVTECLINLIQTKQE